MNNYKKNIFLVGFSGAGKSTIGPVLAKMTNNIFLDLDSEIESYHGKSVIDLFNEQGENNFRTLEHKRLRSIIELTRTKVIATGGGTPLNIENRSIIIQNGITVYLKVSKPTLVKRLMATNNNNNNNSAAQFLTSIFNERATKAFLEKLIDYRTPYYVTIADFSVEVESIAPEEIADKIISHL